MHWSEKIAKDIIKRSPDKEEYVCAGERRRKDLS